MVNIIIPAYNCNKNIGRALGSLVAQTTKYFSITIVDDASTENIEEAIKPFSDLLKITLLRTNVNGGAGVARQIGLDALNKVNSPIDYVMFLDSDDMLPPNSIELLYHIAKKEDLDLVYGDIYLEGGLDKGTLLTLGNNTTWVGGKIYKRDFLNRYNIRFLPDLRCNEDSYFSLVCAYLAEKKKYIDEVTYFWHSNKESITRSTPDFIYEYNDQYLISQVKGIESILTYSEDPNLGGTLANIYKAYELESLIHPERLETANRLLYDLYANPKFISLFSKPNFIMSIHNKLAQSKIINDDILFYPHSFSSFTKFFGVKLGVDKK